MIRSLYVKPPSVASTSSTTFWWALQTQSEWVTEHWEPDIYIWMFFFESSIKFLQSHKDFCKLQRFCLYAPLLKLTKSSFLSTYLLKLTSSKTFVTRKSVSVVIAFPFFRSRFYQYFTYVLISCEFQTKYLKILKYSAQYIRDHLSGTRVRIWMGSKYDAVFSFSCIASCNLTKTFGFSCMPF